MELDLSQKTVTQSLQTVEALLSQNEGEVTLKLDNETVKLNIMQRLAKAGLSVKVRRAGLFWFLALTLQKREEKPRTSSMEVTKEAVSYPQAQRVVNEWWVFQSDQVGTKDHRLGHELLNDLWTDLLDREIGIYLIHRAVLLLKTHPQGQIKAQILACPKSLAFYGLANTYSGPTLPYTDFLTKNKKARLIFI